MNAPACALRLGLLLLAFAVAPSAAKPNLPEAAPDLAYTGVDQSVLINVLANDVELGPGIRLLNVHKPGHGRTQVENGRIRYTPQAGFQGSDQFHYMVQAPNSQPRLGNVTVEVGGGGVILTLSGQVVDSPIPGATVRVSVGGFNFVAVADANGNYVLDIAALSGDAFVTITATGVSATGAPVDFVSLVGEIARLDAAAGADGVLTLDENNQVNVTHLSTAQFVLLADANGGLPPEDDAALLQLTQNIDIEALLELAAVIKLVVDGGEPLPSGVSSVLDLISDDAALAVFIDALDPGQLEDAIADVGSDTQDLTGFSTSRIPGGYAVIFPGDTGTIRVGVSGQFLLRFNGVALGTGSGTGEYVGPVFRTDLGTTWQLAGNRLQVTYDEPTVQTFNYSDGCASFVQTSTSNGLTLTRLQDGAGVDYLEVEESGDVAFIDPNPGDACAPPPNETVVGSYRALGFEEGLSELPFGASENLGTMLLPYFRPAIYPAGGSSGWGAALFDFSTAQVDIPGINPGFAWSISGGRLQLGLTDPVDGVEQYEFRRYQQDGRKGEGVMAVVTRPDGARAATYSLSARVDGSLPAFTEAMLPGRWRSGFDISQFQPDLAEDFGFFLRMYDNPARTGEFEFVTFLPDGTPSGSLFPPMTWGVGTGGDSGKMVALTFRNSGATVAWCDVLTEPGCSLFRRRTWTPVAMDGDRIYVIERLIYRVGGVFGLTPQLISERPNFYELGPLP